MKTWMVLPISAAVAGFVGPPPSRPSAVVGGGRATRGGSPAWAPRMKYGDYFEGDEEEEPSSGVYRNRSLAWSRRYRRLLPYDWARREAMKLGLRSRDDWDDYLADGKCYQNKYLPNRPDEMYADDWVSWEEFLGIIRSYDDTRYLVQRVLRIRTMEDYLAFVLADSKRAEGLRIPYKPDIVYKDKGWIDEGHFFTLEEDGRYLPVLSNWFVVTFCLLLTLDDSFAPP